MKAGGRPDGLARVSRYPRLTRKSLIGRFKTTTVLASRWAVPVCPNGRLSYCAGGCRAVLLKWRALVQTKGCSALH